MSLLCVLCLYEPGNKRPSPAETVCEGYAVCERHLGYVAQGTRWSGIYMNLRDAAKAAAQPHREAGE